MWSGSHAPLPTLSDADALSTTSRAALTPAVVHTPQIAENTLLCSYKKTDNFRESPLWSRL